MIRDDMLKMLGGINFSYLDPPRAWDDVGFTERPIWVNSKGYGYLSCDDPSDFCWKGEGIVHSKWVCILEKLSNHTIQIEDLEGTSLIKLLNEMTYGDFADSVDCLSECLESLLSLTGDCPKNLYCMDSFDGLIFFSNEDDFQKAYEKDWCDYAWEELDDAILERWIHRLYSEEIIVKESE